MGLSSIAYTNNPPNTIANQKIVLDLKVPVGEVHMHPATLSAIENTAGGPTEPCSSAAS
jgi:hypothetical protein